MFKAVWGDPVAQKNGRIGQPQHGVDVFGSPKDRSCFSGVQCKGKNSNYGSAASWQEILDEVSKAKQFSPRLEEWIYVTTAPVDLSLIHI